MNHAALDLRQTREGAEHRYSKSDERQEHAQACEVESNFHKLAMDSECRSDFCRNVIDEEGADETICARLVALVARKECGIIDAEQLAKMAVAALHAELWKQVEA